MRFQKLAALSLFAMLSCLLSAQIAAPQNFKGVTMKGVTVSNPSPPPTTGMFFTPAAGSYPGSPQNIAITNVPGSSGVALFYTQDGSTPSEASKRFTSNIPLSTATTLKALAENVGTVRQDTQNTSGLWKICTPVGGGPGTPTSVKCGGVGSTQPTAWTILYNQTVGGVTGVESISLTGNGSQILVTLGGSGCDSCTKITMDKWIKPLDADTGVINHEHDAWWNSGSTNRLNMIGFQCNQQSAFLQWQYDNEQGSWQNTGVSDKCPLSTSLWTHLIVHAHWVLGDTGCGGLGCTHYDDFYVGTASSPNATSVTMTQHLLNHTLEQDNPGWGSGCADQDQVDLKGSGSHTGGVLVAHNNVTCSFGSVTTGSAAYTF